jgi:hypothetical protein
MSFAYTRRRDICRPGGLTGGALSGDRWLRFTAKVGSDRNVAGRYRVRPAVVVMRRVEQYLPTDASANSDGVRS